MFVTGTALLHSLPRMTYAWPNSDVVIRTVNEYERGHCLSLTLSKTEIVREIDIEFKSMTKYLRVVIGRKMNGGLQI